MHLSIIRLLHRQNTSSVLQCRAGAGTNKKVISSPSPCITLKLAQDCQHQRPGLLCVSSSRYRSNTRCGTLSQAQLSVSPFTYHQEQGYDLLKCAGAGTPSLGNSGHMAERAWAPSVGVAHPHGRMWKLWHVVLGSRLEGSGVGEVGGRGEGWTGHSQIIGSITLQLLRTCSNFQ